MTEEERAGLAILIGEAGQILRKLFEHPDLPQHGPTRPLILMLLERLKGMMLIVRESQKDAIIVARGNGLDAH